MDVQNDPSAYLALLLASTSPAPARPVHTSNPYAQPAIPINYPLSNIREQPPFNASPGSMNFILPPENNSNPMQFHSAAGLAPLPNPYMGTFAPQYQASPYLAGSPAHYQPYQQQIHEQVASASHIEEEDAEMDDEDDIIPQVRSAKQGIEPEESEKEEKPGRNLRRFRKKRKQTPVLVFDDDSDDGDYKEAPSKSTKRVKYDYDSEGAIDPDAAHSSSEEPPEPAPEPKEEPAESKPAATRTSTKPRAPAKYTPSAHKRKGPGGGADAKARSEKASALLNRKGKGRPIPKTVQDCDEADLMMWQWKHSGRSWKDIRNEWVRIMGVVPGRSSLSVRLAKMEDNFIDSGAGNDLMILKYKAEVEAELEDVKWRKVAAKIKKETNGDAKPASIRKRYLQLQDSGWVVGTETGAGDGEEDGEGDGGVEHGSETGGEAAEDGKLLDQKDSGAGAEDEERG